MINNILWNLTHSVSEIVYKGIEKKWKSEEVLLRIQKVVNKGIARMYDMNMDTVPTLKQLEEILDSHKLVDLRARKMYRQGFMDCIRIVYYAIATRFTITPDIREFITKEGGEKKMDATPPYHENIKNPKPPGEACIRGYYPSRRVFREDKEILPGKSQRLVNHSPDGFNWGYGGSGPAQLALAIMLEFVEEKKALALYNIFKSSIIAGLEKGKDFAIPVKAIENWINEQLKKIDI